MDALIIITYSLIIWLIYFKFKLLPWNTPNKVVVFVIPVVGITALMMSLCIFSPSTDDLRVMNRSVEVVPAVGGLVVDVPVEENEPIKKGDVLFKIDPTPYAAAVNKLEAAIEQAEASLVGQNHQVESLRKQRASVAANLELAKKRVEEFKVLVAHNAGNRFDLESAETKVLDLEAKLEAIKAQESQLLANIMTTYEGDQVSVAKLKADLASAQWKLENTVYRAPADGYITNLQLRKGSMTTQFPLRTAMIFVEHEKFIMGTFLQNELHQVKPGNTAELTFKTLPGKVFHSTVEDVVWQQGQGHGTLTGNGPIPSAAPTGEGRYAVRFAIPAEDAHMLRNGSQGDAAIYTTDAHALNVVRMVILRIGAKLNYVVPKTH